MFRRFAVALLITGLASCASQPTQPFVAANAPRDNPLHLCTEEDWSKLQEILRPYIEAARATYPDAKKRFLAGLPERHTFFVTVDLREGPRRERVFLAVDTIKDGVISGRIWSPLNVVKSWQMGQSYSVSEVEIVDWLITQPDGSEEGNVVGKFMDTLPHSCVSETQA